MRVIIVIVVVNNKYNARASMKMIAENIGLCFNKFTNKTKLFSAVMRSVFAR